MTVDINKSYMDSSQRIPKYFIKLMNCIVGLLHSTLKRCQHWGGMWQLFKRTEGHSLGQETMSISSEILEETKSLDETALVGIWALHAAPLSQLPRRSWDFHSVCITVACATYRALDTHEKETAFSSGELVIFVRAVGGEEPTRKSTPQLSKAVLGALQTRRIRTPLNKLLVPWWSPDLSYPKPGPPETFLSLRSSKVIAQGVHLWRAAKEGP